QLSSLGEDFWAKLNKNQASWTDPAIVQAISNYKANVLDAGLAQPNYQTATFTDQAVDLFDGKAAMALNVTSFQNQLQAKHSTAEIDQTVGWFPISKDNSHGLYSPDQTNGLVAFKTGDATREKASRQFLAYLLGPGYADYIKAKRFVSVEPDVPNPADLPQTAI